MHCYQRGQEFLALLPGVGQELPYSLTLLRDLFDLTSDASTVSMDTLAKSLGQDQGLTTKVLAMANSAFYGLQAKVSTLPRALALLGLREIRHLVLILGVQSICSRRTLPHAFDLPGYWRHQLQVAALAKDLALLHNAAGKPALDPDMLYTAGLLHDLGKLLTALHRPRDWESIEELRRAQNLEAHLAEDQYWGLEHGLVGAITLGAWNLPPELTEPVNWHHAPGLAGDCVPQARVICLADAICHALEQPDATVELHPEADQALDALALDFQAALDAGQALFEDHRLDDMADSLR